MTASETPRSRRWPMRFTVWEYPLGMLVAIGIVAALYRPAFDVLAALPSGSIRPGLRGAELAMDGLPIALVGGGLALLTVGWPLSWATGQRLAHERRPWPHLWRFALVGAATGAAGPLLPYFLYVLATALFGAPTVGVYLGIIAGPYLATNAAVFAVVAAIAALLGWAAAAAASVGRDRSRRIGAYAPRSPDPLPTPGWSALLSGPNAGESRE
ncbi:MAG: hypothetical protein J7480_08450 [Microbacteriaceae bacterium]|nr:hypothetical protein [Microbacteriaceae bacterium]